MRWVLVALTGLIVTAALTGWGHQQVAPQRLGLTSTVPASDGACSSPFGSTRYGFEPACARHDAGYDDLRTAAATGHPLPPQARRAIDRRFAADLAGACSSTGCLLTAALYAGAVRVNSWRQGDGVPVIDSGWEAALAALAGGVAALIVRLSMTRAGETRSRPPSTLRPTLPLATAAAALAVSLQPTIVPRPLWLTVLIGGLITAQGYATGAALRRVLRRWWRTGSPGSRVRPGVRQLTADATWSALFVGLAIAAAAGHAGQVRLAIATRTPPPSPAADLLALVGSAVVAAVLGAGTVRFVVAPARRAVRALGRRGRDHRRPAWRRSPQVAGLAVIAVPMSLLTSLPAPLPEAGCGSVAVSADPSGWDGVGSRGRRFVSEAAAGSAWGNRNGAVPLRVYVTRDAADTADGRAALAVRALQRSGGFDRSVLLVVIPTGSGWVNSAAPAALERRLGGDVATVAVQYAASPSWIAYLRGGDGVEESVRSVFTAVHAQVRQLPAERRPQVLAYGESLGAWGGLRSSPDGGVPPGADGALWAGVPAGTRASGGVPDDGGPRAVELTHADDPVAAWSPALAWRPSPAWRHPWLPMLSFWQITGDAIAARTVPAGHGHRYEGELASRWEQVLQQTALRSSAGTVAGNAAQVRWPIGRRSACLHTVTPTALYAGVDRNPSASLALSIAATIAVGLAVLPQIGDPVRPGADPAVLGADLGRVRSAQAADGSGLAPGREQRALHPDPKRHRDHRGGPGGRPLRHRGRPGRCPVAHVRAHRQDRASYHRWTAHGVPLGVPRLPPYDHQPWSRRSHVVHPLSGPSNRPHHA